MLPFLKKSQEASASGPVESIERKPDDGSDSYDPLESAVEDLFAAFKADDIKAGCAALKAALEIHNSDQGDQN